MRKLFCLKFYFILFSLFVLVKIQGVCQNIDDDANKNIDSLISNYGGKVEDIHLVKLLHETALKVMDYDPMLTLNYIDTAMYISKIEGNDSCVGYSYYLYGRVYGQQAKIFEAATNYFKALEYREFFNDTIIGDIYCFLGVTYNRIKSYKIGIKYLEKAEVIYDSINHMSGLGDVNITYGMKYYDEKNYERCIRYVLRAMEYFKKSNNNQRIALAYNNLGKNYEKLKKYDFALDNYRKGLNFANKCNNLYVYFLTEKNIGGAYLNMGRVNEGYAYIERVKEASIKNGYLENIFRSADLLSISYAKEGEYEKAFENLNLYVTYNDSIYSTQNKSKLFQLDFMMEYEKDRREKQVQLIQNEKKTKIQRIIITGSLFIAILIAFFFYYALRNKIRLQRFRQKLLSMKLEREELTRKSNETELRFKNGELEKLALHIIQKNEFIQKIKNKIHLAKTDLKSAEDIAELDSIASYVNQSMSLNEDRKVFRLHLDKYNKDFLFKVLNKYPDLTAMEQRLVVLLRLNFSSKEIAALFNVTAKSVEMYRFNLRKKINVNSNQRLVEFLANI